MNETLVAAPGRVDAQKITKPIQLLAAWLLGLIAIDTAFLVAASHMNGWERSALVLAAILNAPGFLTAMFLLQTRFRPELQEDSFYSKYLDSKTNQVVTRSKFEVIESELARLGTILSEGAASKAVGQNIGHDQLLGRVYKIGINDLLTDWKEIRNRLKKDGIRISEVFGSPYSQEAPNGRYLSMDHQVDFESKLHLLRLFQDLNFDGYGYFDAREEESRESILIGSYGRENDHFPFSAELRDLLASEPEEIDISLIERKSRVVKRSAKLRVHPEETT